VYPHLERLPGVADGMAEVFAPTVVEH